MIGGKQYYRLSDVRQFVRDHCITPVKIKK
jgi:hypothetical protein